MPWIGYLMYAGTGLTVGVLNGLFGAGGGIAAVVLLRLCSEWRQKNGCADPKVDAARRAHATSIALIFPLSIFSAWMYISNGSVVPEDAAVYIPGGILGAVIGAVLLKIVPPGLLKKIFAVFMLYTAYRLMFG